MRILLYSTRPTWSEQSDLSANKTNPTHNAQRKVAEAAGVGERVLRETWHAVFDDAGALYGLGIKTSDDGDAFPGAVPPDETMQKLQNYLFSLIEERFWDYADDQWAYPGLFALCVAERDELRQEGYDRAREAWECLCFAEVLAHKDAEVAKMLKNIYWMKHQYVQLTFRVLAHNQYRMCDEVTRLVHRDIAGVGDTRLIEKTHGILTDADRQSKRMVNDNMALMTELARGEELKNRGIPCVESQWEELMSGAPSKIPWAEKFSSLHRVVPEEF